MIVENFELTGRGNKRSIFHDCFDKNETNQNISMLHKQLANNFNDYFSHDGNKIYLKLLRILVGFL